MNFKHNTTEFFSKPSVAIVLLGALAFGCATVTFGQPGRPFPGSPGFILEFDEAGHGNLILGTGSSPNPGTPVAGGGLTYTLPVLVTPGDVPVYNPDDRSPSNPDGFSDLMTFFNSGGHGVLLYRSLLDESEPFPDPADVFGLTNPGGPAVFESGPEGYNSFVWFAGTEGGGPDYTVYNGLSDVPEPSMFVLGGLGLLGLFLSRYSRGVKNRGLIRGSPGLRN